MDLIERVESYKVLFKECKALEPVSTARAKGYKSATPLQRLEIIRELDTELAEVYSVEIPVITAWVRDDNYVHSTKEIFLGGVLKSVGKTVAKPFIAVKDGASKILHGIGSSLKSIGNMSVKAMVAVKDGASAVLGKIGSTLKSLAIIARVVEA